MVLHLRLLAALGATLELEGRDIYVSEGCYTCHSQMIRPFTWETARYGAPSRDDESIYDHPFQWGSRRIGPDLARLGGKYSHTWHYRHMMDPREINRDSIMPAYTHMATTAVDFGDTAAKMRGLRAVGVPYEADEIQSSEATAQAQHDEILAALVEDAGLSVCEGGATSDCDLVQNSQLVALIAYLQRLGNPPAPEDEGAGGEGEVALRTDTHRTDTLGTGNDTHRNDNDDEEAAR